VTLPDTVPLIGLGWDDLLFLAFAGLMILAALLVVGMRDIIRSGLAMIICFAALAGLYVMAGAPVVAAAQVLVYIGAISVLVLFAIMLTQTKDAPRSLVFQTQVIPAAVAAVILAILIGVSVTATDWTATIARGWTETGADHAKLLATRLFANYTLPFEVVSVLLLAAVIGGVYLARRERGGDD
jgi:NADH-quinone oxidoreductase subunit J